MHSILGKNILYKKPFYVNLFLSFLTILLLSFSFPSPCISYLAWIALVPWFMIIATGYRAGLFSFLIGFLFFVFNLTWIGFVTSFGWILLALYLALYFYGFGLVMHYLRRWLRLQHLFIAPFVWVTFEYLRSIPYFGFPWFFGRIQSIFTFTFDTDCRHYQRVWHIISDRCRLTQQLQI